MWESNFSVHVFLRALLGGRLTKSVVPTTAESTVCTLERNLTLVNEIDL